MAHRGKHSMRDFKRALKGGAKAKMTRSDWREIASMLGSDAGPGVKKKARTNSAPRTRTVSLRNFTGKVRLNLDKSVSILGVGRKKKAKAKARRRK